MLEWESAGKLLRGGSEAGLAPSEGATGFLFVDAQQASQMKTEGLAKIHRPFRSRREKSADSSGRIRAETLTELTQKALESAAIPAEKIILVASDTDHRASRAGELIGMAYTIFPDLDLKSQCYKVDAACGFAGTVSSLTALALAHHAAVTNGSSALCISNQDEFECSAVVVSPLLDGAASMTASA